MEPSRELIAAIRCAKVEQARRMSFQEKLLAGSELFDDACEITKGGIRADHPEFTEEQALEELRRRLRLRERREGAA